MTDATEHTPHPPVQPQPQHQWLQQLVGEWTFAGQAAAAPGEAPAPFQGTERVRALGGLWVLIEGEMPAGDTPVQWLMTLGYNIQQQRYVGTWLGSMETHLWVYAGALDAAQRVLTLEAEGPRMTDGQLARFRDVIEIQSADRRTLTSYILGDDGQWHQIVSITYRRQAGVDR
ncbi:MAG TPA: DUF1579 domain-containing protein [Chloroflexota bacterium]|jgi:hypothetical protein|nr:DUF1579 domain-containing protein [Chloroflexota bacterium]